MPCRRQGHASRVTDFLMNGIIGGTSLLSSSLFEKWDKRKIKTPYGLVNARIKKNTVFIQRHGHPPAPPHLINHRANIWSLKSLGVRKVLSVNSVGSLKRSLKPGFFVIPADFISPWIVPTFFENEMKFIVPEMDRSMRDYLHELCLDLGMNVHAGGVYIQATGPRLETKAEISLFKRFGDIIGMTMASEATLCMEYEIPYVSLCSIDNYCNGIVKVPLTIEEISQNWKKNIKTIERLIRLLLKKDFS